VINIIMGFRDMGCYTHDSFNVRNLSISRLRKFKC
jgi:hypothetical protein